MAITWNNPQHLYLLMYIINNCLLAMKLSFTASCTGAFRGIEKKYKQPDDAKFFGKKEENKLTEESSEPSQPKIYKVDRIVGTHQNEVENFLLHLFVSTNLMVAITIVPHSIEAAWVHFIGGTILLFSFTLVRYVYAFFYFIGLAPARSLLFLGGTIINMTILVWSIIAILV
eukprot:gene5010-8608_t